MPGVHTVGFFLARAPDVTGPYEPVSGDWHKTTITWPQDAEMRPACTDPFIWRDSRGAFHSVFHCRNWYAGSPSDAGGHAFSADGLHWTLAAEPAWNTTVLHTDGTNTTFFHRERPQVYIDPATGSPAALFNGVSLANQNQPFPWQKHCPPHPSHIQVPPPYYMSVYLSRFVSVCVPLSVSLSLCVSLSVSVSLRVSLCLSVSVPSPILSGAGRVRSEHGLRPADQRMNQQLNEIG